MGRPHSKHRVPDKNAGWCAHHTVLTAQMHFLLKTPSSRLCRGRRRVQGEGSRRWVQGWRARSAGGHVSGSSVPLGTVHRLRQPVSPALWPEAGRSASLRWQVIRRVRGTKVPPFKGVRIVAELSDNGQAAPEPAPHRQPPKAGGRHCAFTPVAAALATAASSSQHRLRPRGPPAAPGPVLSGPATLLQPPPARPSPAVPWPYPARPPIAQPSLVALW